MNQVFSIVRADFVQRFRSNTFMILTLVSVVAAYKFVPLPEDNYTTIRIGDFTGLNNSAWIGHSTAILASFFLWFIGFYVINNSIRRDVETGVGQIIASTSVTNFLYLLAKALSHFLLLFFIVAIIFFMGLGLSLFRFDTYPFDFFQFAAPYIFTTIPSIFFLSALTVFFEVKFGQRTNHMNFVFFIVFVAMISVTNLLTESYLGWIDPLGIKFLVNEILSVVAQTLPSGSTEISVGINYNEHLNVRYFLFHGSDLSCDYYISRLLWIFLALLLIKLSSIIFHRFDTKFISSKKVSRHSTKISRVESHARKIYWDKMIKSEIDFGILPLIKLEFLMLIRKGPIRFWILNLGCFIGLFILPLESALHIGLPLFWYLQVNRWADLCTKERDFRTDAFIYCTYKPLQRLLLSQIIAAISLAVLLALPILFRLVISMQFLKAINVVLAAILLVSFSVFTGIFFGGKRFFDFSFLLITYVVVSTGLNTSFIIHAVNQQRYIFFQIVLILFFLIASFWIRSVKLKRN